MIPSYQCPLLLSIRLSLCRLLFPSGCIFDFPCILSVLQCVMCLGVDLFLFNYLEERRLLFSLRSQIILIDRFHADSSLLQYCVFTISSIPFFWGSHQICVGDSQSVSMSLSFYFALVVLALTPAPCSNSLAPASGSLFRDAIVSSRKSLPSSAVPQFYF